MKASIRRMTVIALVTVFLAASALFVRPTAAGTLSTSIIGMFPKDVGEFAYADMKAARKFAWFKQLRDQMLPQRFRQFEQFLASAGVDPDSQVDELAWAAIPAGKEHGEQIVGVALGQFAPDSAEDRFKQQKMPMVEVRGFHLYAYGTGAGTNDILFFFLDSNTAVFGHRGALEKLIEVRQGGAESILQNDLLAPLISEANGSGLIWAVMNQSYTRLGMQQLIPQANQFPDAAKIVNRIQAMLVSVQADNGVDAKIQTVCASPEDANVLAAGLQAAVMMRRYQEAQTNPDLAKALDGVRVSPRGERLMIDIPVSDDQMNTLLHNKTFSVPM
ncbi:MAG TPA: hypothetical protein VG033_03735 [Candidatus Acidoferrales bacterium]|jgi:hypothetical protein|nr:hypothetical protein [Candidatus Acidoferrales bacterium]